jgi:hypothetical protein
MWSEDAEVMKDSGGEAELRCRKAPVSTRMGPS